MPCLPARNDNHVQWVLTAQIPIFMHGLADDPINVCGAAVVLCEKILRKLCVFAVIMSFMDEPLNSSPDRELLAG